MKLMLMLVVALLSTSVVGVEVMAPYLMHGQSTYLLPADRLAGCWLISLFTIAGFAYQLGIEETRHKSRIERNQQRSS